MRATALLLFSVVLGALAWIYADLYLRVDLPGAGSALQAAFEGASAGVAWVVVERSRRLALGGGVAALLLLGAVPRPRWLAWPAQILAAALLLVPIGLGGLFERAAALGLLAAAGVGVRSRPASPSHAPPSAVPRALLALAAGGLALGAGAWLLGLLEARSSSYAPLRWLAQNSGEDARRAWGLGLASAGGVASAAALRRGLGRPLGLALLASALASAAVVPALDPTAPWAPLLALALAPLAFGIGRGARPGLDPASWAGTLAPAAALAGLLVGSSYLLRVFGCPPPVYPALSRVADAGPVFRVALSPERAVFALRDERRLGVLDRSQPGPWSYVDTSALPGADEPALPGQSYASFEELLFADGRFVGTALGGHPDFYSTAVSPPNTVHNLFFTVPADASRVDSTWGREHLCWIGALAASGDELAAGCEYEPRLQLLRRGEVVEELEDEAVGDVAALSWRGDALWSVSFWRGSRVARYGLHPLRLLQSRALGGAYYDLAVDEGRDRLVASDYMGSRLRLLRASDLGDVATIRTGLGARALAVDRERGLILASSVYDGVITAADTTTGRVLGRLRVGGHVKDIAIDPSRAAWFASRCGVYRLDLARWP